MKFNKNFSTHQNQQEDQLNSDKILQQPQFHKNYKYTLQTKIGISFLCIFIIGWSIYQSYYKKTIEQQEKVPIIIDGFIPKKFQSLEINRKRQQENQYFQKQQYNKMKQQLAQKQKIKQLIEKKKFLQQYYKQELPPRTYLEQPHLPDYQFSLWKIFGKPDSIIKNNCVLINSVNILTLNTIKTIENLLKKSQNKLIYLLVSRYDYKGDYLIQKNFLNKNKFKQRIEIDADYVFITQIKNQCDKLTYLYGNFVLNQQMVNNIQEQSKNQNSSSLFFTSKYHSQNNKQIHLPNLSQKDLSLFQPQVFSSYLYIFDTEFLKIITPVNFLYYAKYTIDQTILIPLLVLYQLGNRMYTNDKIYHSFSIKYPSFKHFAIKSTQQQKNSICFVSYPNNPQIVKQKQIVQYLQTIRNQQRDVRSKNLMNISIILYLPYQYNKTFQLYNLSIKLIKFLKQYNITRVRLRIRNEKAVSNFAIYDNLYAYCPNKCIIASSRHNVKFQKNMAKQVLQYITQNFHYYVFNIEKQNSLKITYQEKYKFQDQSNDNKWTIYQKIKYIQIFKSDLLKTGVFFVLKNQEVDFYESEASFIIHLMKLVRINIGYIRKTLAKVIQRQYTQKQLRQIPIIKKSGKIDSIVWNQLFPYQYNCLQNPVLRKNAPKKIPPIIHQIWLSQDKISQVRYVLRDTLVKKNPNFTVLLWRKENLTRQSAPLTYYITERILQRHKQSSTSLYAMAADLFRYQLILSYGGLYIDFKFQGVKPLDNFLKYQNFFADFDIGIIRYGVPKAVGNPVMGATKNNYYLRYMLNQLVLEQKVQFQLIIPRVTGSYILRQSITNKQLFCSIGYGYYFFYPRQYQKIVNQCGGTNKKFDQYQQVFSINFYLSPEPVKIGIPCKQYPDSYLINYNPLGQTWLSTKRKID